MPTDPFLDDGSRVVTLEAFDFIFRNELKRAVRAQNFLTLLQLETTPVPQPRAGDVIASWPGWWAATCAKPIW